MKVDWLSRSVHTLALKYGLCTNEAAFHEELRRFKITQKVEPTLNPHSSACTHFLESLELNVVCALIFMKLNPKHSREQHYSLLVHEAMHVWQRHLLLIGESKPSEEFEAYAIQAISQALMCSFLEQTKGFKFAR